MLVQVRLLKTKLGFFLSLCFRLVLNVRDDYIKIYMSHIYIYISLLGFFLVKNRNHNRYVINEFITENHNRYVINEFITENHNRYVINEFITENHNRYVINEFITKKP